MKNGKLGVGFVGAGFNATFHIKSWVGVRHADVMGVVSRTREKAERAAKLAREIGVGDAKAFGSVKEMVRDPAVDAVWICAPNFTRIETMEEIVEHGRGKLIGIACEKPLARNVKEARRMLELVQNGKFLHGYLENQVFAPIVTRGKELLWRRGAAAAGRPYLARGAEEHGGPHEPWFWDGKRQGGGVLNDMMCHTIEATRFLLQDPNKGPESLTPKAVSCEIATLKWSRKEYADRLKKISKGSVDYVKAPAEDFARSTIFWESDEGLPVTTEATTSWGFVGPGLRLSIEAMGPEYYMQGSTLASSLNIFFSREVKGAAGEDMVEKQTAEQGLMPVVASEEVEYGYTTENRHMVEAFRAGRMPSETFEHGLRVSELLMTCYMAAERGERLAFPPKGLENFVPAVAQGTYRPSHVLQGRPS